MNELPLRGRIAAAAAWMVGFRLLDRAIGILSLVILARLLVPSDFGLVALATSIIAIVELFTAFSFDVALIRSREVSRAHYDTAWTLNVIISAGCALLIAAAALPASTFYGEPRLAAVMWWLAAATWIRSFENIGVVAFRKELRFDREFRLLLARRIAVFLTTVGAALATRSYWALVLGNLVGSAGAVALSYAMHPFRPRPDLSARRELLNFSIWVLLGNAVNTLAQRSTDLVIGKVLGPGALGLFNLASEVAHLPTTELSAPINRAAYPGYAMAAADRARLRSQFLEVQGLTALLTAPAAIGIAMVAPLLVPLLLGEAWREAVPLLAILAISGLLASWRTNLGYVFFAMGRSGVVAVMGTARFVLVVPALVYGTIQFGARGAAWAVLAVSVAMLPLMHLFANRMLDVRWTDHLNVLWRPAAAGSVMGLLVRQSLDWSDGSFAALAAVIGGGALTYVATVVLLWAAAGFPRSAETQLRNAMTNALARLLRAKTR